MGTSQPRLYVIGFGLMIPDHITAQARSAISRCSKIYTIVQEPPELWLPAERHGLTEIVNALDFYNDGAIRSENYRRLADSIIEELAKGEVTAYVTYGNPMAYDSVAQSLVCETEKRGIAARVIPGISSLDSIMCDLALDIAPGIQVFEASWLLACGIKPRPDVHMLLVQMGSFGSYRAHYQERRDGNSLYELVSHLAESYPKGHPVSLVRSTGHGDQPAIVRQVQLRELCQVSADELSGASLYVPAATRPQFNGAILSKMIET